MKVFSYSHIGKRSNQEDALYVDQASKNLFLVCDGVGGNVHGDYASAFVKDFLQENLSSYVSLDSETLTATIWEAFQYMDNIGRKRKAYAKMATTLAMSWIEPLNHKAIFCHIGDSRILYMKESDGSNWFSKDHSVVMELLESGVLESEKELKTHPLRNRVTKVISPSTVFDKDNLDIKVVNNLGVGDKILLCTDGCLERYTSLELFEHFRNDSIALESRWDIFKNGCIQSSNDNNTAILIEI